MIRRPGQRWPRWSWHRGAGLVGSLSLYHNHSRLLGLTSFCWPTTSLLLLSSFENCSDGAILRSSSLLIMSGSRSITEPWWCWPLGTLPTRLGYCSRTFWLLRVSSCAVSAEWRGKADGIELRRNQAAKSSGNRLAGWLVGPRGHRPPRTPGPPSETGANNRFLPTERGSVSWLSRQPRERRTARFIAGWWERRSSVRWWLSYAGKRGNLCNRTECRRPASNKRAAGGRYPMKKLAIENFSAFLLYLCFFSLARWPSLVEVK